MHDDPHLLVRFVEAQSPIYSQVLKELKEGCKVSHWMWFIFPQISGLGSSSMARRYAIAGVDEARAYLSHDLLGDRLVECTQLALKSARVGAINTNRQLTAQ